MSKSSREQGRVTDLYNLHNTNIHEKIAMEKKKRDGLNIVLVVQLNGLDSCCLVRFEKITKGKRICIAKW